GPLLGAGEVPLVGAGLVSPVYAVAAVDDVLGAIGDPGLAPQSGALQRLGLQRPRVVGQLAVRHAVGVAAGDEEAALGELGVDVGLDPPGLNDRAPEVGRLGLPSHGHGR